MPNETAPPIPVKRVEKLFEDREAREQRPITTERRFHVAADREPRVETRVELVDRGDGQSNFHLSAWVRKYLHWYFYAFGRRLS